MQEYSGYVLQYGKEKSYFILQTIWKKACAFCNPFIVLYIFTKKKNVVAATKKKKNNQIENLFAQFLATLCIMYSNRFSTKYITRNLVFFNHCTINMIIMRQVYVFVTICSCIQKSNFECKGINIFSFVGMSNRHDENSYIQVPIKYIIKILRFNSTQ